MIAALVVLLEIAACLGFGIAALRLLGVFAELEARERLPWAFAIGFGILGWLVFPLGIAGRLDHVSLALLLVLGVAFFVGLGRQTIVHRATEWRPGQWRWPEIGLAIVLAIAVGFDFVEALAPPADADTLAYHFALPKQFLAAGRIEFVPRAVDGAVPLLVQMTYVPALALGGETALTLWTFASGWGLAVLFYGLARRHLDAAWSLAATAALMTAPAIIHGAGSGQVEVRLGLFALAAAAAAARAVKRDELDHAVLAGLAAGFYAGGKYVGLLLVAAAGVVVLWGPGWLKRGAVFAVAALVAGGQWYVWNWAHTGDPVFPMLFGWVPYAGPWDAAHDANLKAVFFAQERAVDIDPLWLLLYPFKAALWPDVKFESGRTGFGPYLWLVLPFALAGLVRHRSRAWASELAPVAAIAVLFYGLWFVTGSSQRVRHLVPLLPLAVLVATVAARRWAEAARVRPLAAAFAVTIGFQLAAHGFFTLSFARYLVTGESREDFLERSVSLYRPAAWINAHLGERDRVLLEERQLVYLIDRPTFLAHGVFEARVDLRSEADDAGRFLAQIRALGVTHLLMRTKPESRLDILASRLAQAGCARAMETFDARFLESRTLPSLGTAGLQPMTVLAVDGAGCRPISN